MYTYTKGESCGTLPGSGASGVAINWNHNSKTAEPALFVFTEVSTGRQTQYQVPPNIHFCFPLDAGNYLVSVFANNLERYRDTLVLSPGTTTPFKPVLNPSIPLPKTLKDIVAKFNVSGSYNSRDLNVPKNTTVVLDSQNNAFSGDWVDVEFKDVAAAKRVIGNADEIWKNYSRFPQLDATLTNTPVAIARRAAQEYVYGNSSTVRYWQTQIDQAVFDEVWRFPLFIWGTVTINAGGVLVIGDRGNFFACERLRMHVTATLLIRGDGPIHVEPASLETFC